jgi:hypothetical protein
MGIKIIDNFLDYNIFNDLKKVIISDNFPWFVQQKITGEENESKNNSNYFLCHKIYGNNVPNSDLYNMIKTLLIDKISETEDIKSLLRIKINHYPNNSILCEHELHKDFSFKHTAMLFSINTCDGYTYFENGEKIESKENRLLIFDGSVKHGSTNCTNSKYRININANWL